MFLLIAINNLGSRIVPKWAQAGGTDNPTWNKIERMSTYALDPTLSMPKSIREPARAARGMFMAKNVPCGKVLNNMKDACIDRAARDVGINLNA